ncbi:NifX-associated nitrogen fixation protein [Kamptonema animale CS-326]|jgi:probable nitrogen fixation protein|uniref:NifX-associated nitrogen fixation protein n=1 Tax=Kamptonema animale TaxID=92934 RepID=UPI00232EE4AF|nr:NifX-associated nitrogen fixation protein [Kamptonema animale]MDB9512306.1 NifX-associated nitrogen fixation protein [Kamptonema animale CS-326]
MNTTETATDNTQSDVIKHPFLQELLRQIRAEDSYGFYRNWSDELILKPFVVTKQEKRKIPVDGDVEPNTKGRIQLFYRAIAARIEKESGLLSQIVIDLSHEGFGWALVFSGRLLLVARTLRDAQRFGFDSLEKLAEEGEKLTLSGIELGKSYPEVGKL